MFVGLDLPRGKEKPAGRLGNNQKLKPSSLEQKFPMGWGTRTWLQAHPLLPAVSSSWEH